MSPPASKEFLRPWLNLSAAAVTRSLTVPSFVIISLLYARAPTNGARVPRLPQNVAIRRKKPGYRADDQDEWDEEGNYRPKTLLSQYDEELEGEKKSSFVIGEWGKLRNRRDVEMWVG